MNFALFAVLVSLQIITSRGQYPDVTFEDLLELKEDIEDLIQFAQEHSPTGESGEWLLARMVRLGFHDCAGGCDGCLNMENPSNAGLDSAVDYLEALYTDTSFPPAWNTRMSRADFWALSATLAARLGADNQERRQRNPGPEFVPEFEYYYGRSDCNGGGPYYSKNNNFPNGHMDIEGIESYFAEEFEMDVYEAVTLIGAHTLGEARRSNSGFRGVWIETPDGPLKDILDHRLYVDIVDKNNQLQWVQEGLGPPANPHTYQWIYGSEELVGQGKKGLMLNSDMALYKNMSLIDPDTGFTDVPFDDIPLSKLTHVLVEAYAKDNQLWLTNFVQVFSKMLKNGYHRRQCQLSEIEGYIGPNNPGR